MNKTPIDWVKNPDGTQGYTWNPITGCLNGCEYCYARKLANTRLKATYLANRNIATYDPITEASAVAVGYSPFQDPFYPRFWEDRLITPARSLSNYLRTKPKGIFVCDMSDLFGIGIPEEWTRRVLADCRVHHKHRFYLLTKQPQNLKKFSPFPDNCWVGVTATDQEMMYWAVSGLEKIQAKVKYLSFEPLLEWKSPKDWLVSSMSDYLSWAGIKWVIIGSQTKPAVMPKIEWVNEIVDAADKAGIPVFLKKNLAGLLAHNDRWAFGHDEDIPQMLSLRQEMPLLGQ